MAVREPHVTLDDFVQFVFRDENVDRMFELINGEIVEVSPSRSGHSEVAALIIIAVGNYCREKGLSGRVTGEAGTYNVLGNVIAPDVAYKTTPTDRVNYPDPVPPEFAIEVISPTDRKPDIARKRQIYLDAGILYWEVYVDDGRIDVYPPGQPMRSLGMDDTLDGGAVLPGFTLPVKDVLDLW